MTQPNRYKIWLLRYGPSLAMMVAIFLFSATPSAELPNFGGIDTLIKKGAHMIGYTLLCLSYWHALGGKGWRARLVSLLLASIFAATDEFHQYFVPGRHASPIDWGIDTVGAALGVWIAGYLPAWLRIGLLKYFPTPKRRDAEDKH
jgi:VanZ family protein